jgi:hypothetical protein
MSFRLKLEGAVKWACTRLGEGEKEGRVCVRKIILIERERGMGRGGSLSSLREDGRGR